MMANEFVPMIPGCACFTCGGCNRLELQAFAGLSFCLGSDDEDKRVDRKSEEIIEQCKMVIAEMTNRTRW